MPAWRNSWRPARLEEILPSGVVRCHLSPRNCTLKEGQNGFCGVRGNRGGCLVTMNYGKSVHITEETIETEAVNHYSPGERILSLGNIGCMLNCVFCQNWKTAQAKCVDDKDVHLYSPEDVVEIALRRNIRCLSWTYNDPVVWHEFVLDTAKLARQAGLINLYKSAFFISAEAIDELIPYIDIFSISVKSADPEFYKKYTSGWMDPVLDGCKRVFRAGRHVEVSNLMVTDISDSEESARRVVEWVLRELDSTVPLHFVRFHPDYKMRDTERTPVPRILRAREIALAMGVENVYVGNMYDTPWTNTYCRSCGSLLVERYGLNASVTGVDAFGKCLKCGRDSHVKLLPPSRPVPTTENPGPDLTEVRAMNWHGDVRGAHLQIVNSGSETAHAYYRRHAENAHDAAWRVLSLKGGEGYRVSVAKSRAEETGLEVAAQRGIHCLIHEVFDRAHFPTVPVDEGQAETDVTPLPVYQGKQVSIRAMKAQSGC